jgi:membrane fusion protein
MSLFRQEVYENQRFRLHGDVMLTRAVSNWSLIFLLIAVVGAVSVWIATGRYARTEQVVGRIVPDGAMTKIVPIHPGVITRLNVHEGDEVRAGQPLATVLVEQGSEDRSDPSAANLGSIDAQSRLIDRQVGLAQQTQAGDASKLRSSLAQYDSEIASLGDEITFQTRVVQSAKDSFEPLTEVMNKGFVSKIQYEQKRQAYLAAQEQLAQMRSQRAQMEGQLREARVALGQLPTQTMSKITDLRTSQLGLTQKRIEAENARSYVINAPVAGRVSALQVTQGSTVNSLMPMMSVVADGAKMIAEVYAPSRAVGFAKPGEEVRLMYDAFPYQRFGSFPGHIALISHNVLAPNEVDPAMQPQIKEPVYRVRVVLNDQWVRAFGDAVPLQPGMTLQANIVLDRRTFLDWLLEPINAVRNRT